MNEKFNINIVGIGAATTADIDNLPDAETVAKITSRGTESVVPKVMAIMKHDTICSFVVNGVIYYPSTTPAEID